jgi:hypothetical protein
MKKVYEYRMHRVQGSLNHPDWVEDGGHFWNGSTYLAVIPDDSQRNYYIPDTLIELNKADVLARLIERQHSDIVSDKITNSFNEIMSNNELADYVDQWWSTNVGDN